MAALRRGCAHDGTSIGPLVRAEPRRTHRRPPRAQQCADASPAPRHAALNGGVSTCRDASGSRLCPCRVPVCPRRDQICPCRAHDQSWRFDLMGWRGECSESLWGPLVTLWDGARATGVRVLLPETSVRERVADSQRIRWRDRLAVGTTGRAGPSRAARRPPGRACGGRPGRLGDAGGVIRGGRDRHRRSFVANPSWPLEASSSDASTRNGPAVLVDASRTRSSVGAGATRAERPGQNGRR